jgi:hypothetical protein
MAKRKKSSGSKNHRLSKRIKGGGLTPKGAGRTKRSRAGSSRGGQGSPNRARLRGHQRKKRRPLFELERDGLTHSSLSLFLECREQYALTYLDGYTPKAIVEPTEFGSIMHYGIEHQFNYATPEECIHSITDQYRQWRIPTLLHSRERDTLERLLGLVEVTFPRYCRYWHEDDQRITWIKREVKFKVPYEVNTPTGPRRIYLQGMRDGLYRVPKTSKLGIFETKNKSKVDDSAIHDSLKADKQTLFYIWVTYLETGELPEQVMYNVIRRTNKKPLKGRGKNAKAENIVDFFNRIAAEIDKNPEDYFKRWKVDLVPSDVTEFVKKTLDPEIVNYLLWYDSVKKNPLRHERWLEENKSPYHSQNLNALTGRYGKAAMSDLIVHNSLRNYRIRSEVFPELADSFLVSP